jgi:hypothetical protein
MFKNPSLPAYKMIGISSLSLSFSLFYLSPLSLSLSLYLFASLSLCVSKHYPLHTVFSVYAVWSVAVQAVNGDENEWVNRMR